VGIFSRTPKVSPGAPISGPKEVIVVGDEYFPVVSRLRAGPVPGVTLEPEPANKYDKNAVLVRVNGEPAGYLSAARAATYRPIITGRHPVEALVKQHSINLPDLALFVMMPRIDRHA
jgi:hypothetical protein